MTFQVQDKTRQIAGAFVKDTFFAEAAWFDVTVMIEDGEGVRVLENSSPLVGQAGRS